MAGNVGAMELSALSRELEHACRSGDKEDRRAVGARAEHGGRKGHDGPGRAIEGKVYPNRALRESRSDELT